MQVTYQTVTGLTALKETPLQRSVRQWPRAIPHDELTEAAMRACLDSGWSASEPETTLSADRGSAFAVWECSTDNGPVAVGLLNHAVGTAKSKTARGPITMFAGIPEKEGPVWLAEHKLIRVQHQRFDPLEECRWAAENLELRMRRLAPAITKLKETPIDPKEADAILFAASRAGLIAFSRLRKVDRILKELDRNAWSLLRAFAAANRLSPPHEQGRSGTEFFRSVVSQLNVKGV